MASLRLILICAVLALGLAACGDKTAPKDEDAELLKQTVPVRVLRADLGRGGTTSLYPDGRVIVRVMHLGGGTTWLGKWVEQEGLLTVTLPRRQELTRDWNAPEDLDPPDALVLRRADDESWIETRSTLNPFTKTPLTWTLSGIHRSPKVALERDYRFATEEEWWEHWEGAIKDEPEKSKSEK